MSTSDGLEKIGEGMKKCCKGMEDVCVGVQKLGEQVPENKKKIGANEQSIKELKTTTEKHGTDIATIEKETLKASVADERFSKKSEVRPLTESVQKLENDAPNHASKKSVEENARKIGINSNKIDVNSEKIKEVDDKADSNTSKITDLETDLETNYLNKTDASTMYTPLKTSTNHEDRISTLENNTITTETAKSMFATVSSFEKRGEVIENIQTNYVTKKQAKDLYASKSDGDDNAEKIKNLENRCITKVEAEEQFLQKNEHEEFQKDLTTWKDGVEEEQEKDKNEIDALQVKADDLIISNRMMETRMRAAEDNQLQQTAIVCRRAMEDIIWVDSFFRASKKRDADVEALERKLSHKKCRQG